MCIIHQFIPNGSTETETGLVFRTSLVTCVLLSFEKAVSLDFVEEKETSKFQNY